MTAEIVSCRRRLLPLTLGLALVWLLPACHRAQPAEYKPSEEAKNDQPGLFTVPPDQLARLKTTEVRTANWPVAIHTTGTVDWDADHTTQAITQANGPISRILVDLGTPCKRTSRCCTSPVPTWPTPLPRTARRATARRTTNGSSTE